MPTSLNVNSADFRTRLSELLGQVRGGAAVTVMQWDRAIAAAVPPSRELLARASEQATLTELRQNLRSYLNRAAQHTLVVVTEHGRPTAILGPTHLALPHHASPILTGGQRMPRVVTFYNQAGGVGKTSLSRDIAYLLSRRGFRTLLIDHDPQASLTMFLGLHLTSESADGTVRAADLPLAHTVYAAITDEEAALPQPTRISDSLDIIGSTSKLSRASALLMNERDLLLNLRRKLHARSDYDVVIIDAPPGREVLALNALIAADDVVVVTSTNSKSLDNLHNVLEVVDNARSAVQAVEPEHDLAVRLFAVTQFTPNQRHDQESLEYLQNFSQAVPVSTPVRFRSAVFKDAQLYHLPVPAYLPRNPAVQELETLTDEFVQALNLRAVAS
ncbi:chromosome partitioning protein [Deinobacterium chartae]|uniref:Chromosome partitioning protein n=1 Tax=Deinobacterium chartae TaxID=521158 RepID=A0A841I3T1_9DEIO|nr:type II toxin-antitoxin system prevent-host-death family antitoxin [Deinobacterium chartae]MBB6099696.1 chromosome partitioning protein [Deinobacterium chartae]